MDFGQAQVLFTAKTLQDLLNQIQLVPRETYLFIEIVWLTLSFPGSSSTACIVILLRQFPH